MSIFWSLWIIILTVINMGLVLWVLLANRKVAVRDDADPENRKTGHVYDGIEEYDNPLPRWWFFLFIGTFVFGAIYLVFYPGMGAFPGLLGWTSTGQLYTQQERAEERYADRFGHYADMSIEELVQEHRAMRMGQRLFANNCAACHGSDGGGGYGFPNLTNTDWQWGGSPEQIKRSITEGREGIMPPWDHVLDESGIADVAEYVLQLAGRDHDSERAERGATPYRQYCAACHGAEGGGNQALGAPNLANDIWLYGGEASDLRRIIRSGRTGIMPAQKHLLSEERIHLLTAYVYGLSQEE